MIVHDEIVRERAPWSRVIGGSQTLRIVDVGGNQAVDCLLFDAHDRRERYSAPATMVAQGGIFLVEGTVLRTGEGEPLMTVTGTSCARHDTIGGACSKESNTLRYGFHTASQHACVENFVLEGLRWVVAHCADPAVGIDVAVAAGDMHLEGRSNLT